MFLTYGNQRDFQALQPSYMRSVVKLCRRIIKCFQGIPLQHVKINSDSCIMVHLA